MFLILHVLQMSGIHFFRLITPNIDGLMHRANVHNAISRVTCNLWRSKTWPVHFLEALEAASMPPPHLVSRLRTMSPLRVATLAVLCVAVSAGIKPDNLHKIYSSMAGIYSTANKTVIDKTASYLSVPVKSHCVCRTMCVTDTRCSAYWVTPSPGGGLGCNLTERGPFVHVPQPHDGAFYGYKKTDPGHFREDGMIYELVDDVVPWSTAHWRCNKTEGYRLGIYKTETQCLILLDFHHTTHKTITDCISVYLEKINNEELWGDGSPYKAYKNFTCIELDPSDPYSTKYQLGISVKLALHDRLDASPCRYVCQSDPFNFNLP